MTISQNKTFSIAFVLVLLLQLYMPSFRYNIFFQIFVISIVFFVGKPIISKSIAVLIAPIVLATGIGFLPILFNDYPLTNTIKDITHSIKPIVGIIVGYLLFRQVNDFKSFVKTVIIAGVACAAFHSIRLLLFAGNSESVSDLRSFGLDNFLELFSLFFILAAPKLFNEKLFKSKLSGNIMTFLLVFSNVFYFSRTMMVVFVIITLSIYGHTKLTIKSLKIIGILCVVVLSMYAYLYSIKIDRSGSGVETFFYKVKIAPEELFKTKIDRENHQDLWDHWRGYEAKCAFQLMETKPYSYLIGTGFGSQVNLRFKAPLGDSKTGMKYISELHNGYAYVWYKKGFIGLALVLFFLYQLYLFGYKKPINLQHEFLLKIISAIGLVYLFTTLTITGIYNSSDVISIVLGALLFFETKISAENK
jgi:hypothetical protein